MMHKAIVKHIVFMFSDLITNYFTELIIIFHPFFFNNSLFFQWVFSCSFFSQYDLYFSLFFIFGDIVIIHFQMCKKIYIYNYVQFCFCKFRWISKQLLICNTYLADFYYFLNSLLQLYLYRILLLVFYRP